MNVVMVSVMLIMGGEYHECCNGECNAHNEG